MDKLDQLFEKQYELQKYMSITMDQEYINMMTLACIDELLEALHETKWKNWKKNQVYDEPKFQKELIDAWHFLINLTLASGMTSDDLYKRFIYKNDENHQRQKENY